MTPNRIVATRTRMGLMWFHYFSIWANFVIFKEGISWASSRLDAGADSWKNKIAGMDAIGGILKKTGDSQKFSRLFRVNKSIDSYTLVHFLHMSDHARARGRGLIGVALGFLFYVQDLLVWS